jgi:hypothetical protein
MTGFSHQRAAIKNDPVRVVVKRRGSGEILAVRAAMGFGCAETSAPVIIHLGGSGEIRTHGWLAPSPVFKTGALNRSATLP